MCDLTDRAITFCVLPCSSARSVNHLIEADPPRHQSPRDRAGPIQRRTLVRPQRSCSSSRSGAASPTGPAAMCPAEGTPRGGKQGVSLEARDHCKPHVSSSALPQSRPRRALAQARFSHQVSRREACSVPLSMEPKAEQFTFCQAFA